MATHRLLLFAVLSAGLTVPPLAARAEEPKASVQGVEDDDLRDLIRKAIGTADKPASSRFEARRRGREAAESATAVLRSEGFYASEVTTDLGDGEENADAEAAPKAVVKVEEGPVFHIKRPSIAWENEAPTPEVQSAGTLAMALRRGAPGRANDVLAAEGRIVSAIQQRGHADAEALPREVIVDHADKTLMPTFKIDAGPLVKLDGLVLDYRGRTDKAWIRKLVPWKPGSVYAPDEMGELERRLRETGAFDTVQVALQPADQLTPEGWRPVLLTLKDRPRRSLEIGAGYSTSEGAGLDITTTRYNSWKRADTRIIALRLAELQQRLDYKVSLPHWREPRQTLSLTASVYNEVTDAYDQTGASLIADVTRRSGVNAYLTYGVSVDGGRVAEILTVGNVVLRGIDRDLYNVALLGALAIDRSSDPLDPKSGWRVEARAEPIVTFGDAQLTYLKLTGQGSYYLPLDEAERFVIATRVKAGVISGADSADVPAARRFYSGGGGSVRGYGYQGIGPRISSTPLGGISLAEASVEFRYQLTEKWGAVAFIDGGAVGTDNFPHGDDFSAGVGFGVRYNLGFGPIRADIAFPLDPRDDDAPFQIYISIGQAF
ncbi:autotransporter assembly complex family protein [Caulobacter sp. NIBR1757]|uniref:autotransporter assembly complex protein TamA n=1 Tax=Caulobacter sp. NIBR1757 TaxID=3016000 RepID=UPI0022F08E5E|nr:autotransporter assembly complex family protein [Caulobacter sp. NIBR1757]